MFNLATVPVLPGGVAASGSQPLGGARCQRRGGHRAHGSAWFAPGGLCWVQPGSLGRGGPAPAGSWGALPPPGLPSPQFSAVNRHDFLSLSSALPISFQARTLLPFLIRSLPPKPFLHGSGGRACLWIGHWMGGGGKGEQTLPTWMRHACQSLSPVARAHRPGGTRAVSLAGRNNRHSSRHFVFRRRDHPPRRFSNRPVIPGARHPPRNPTQRLTTRAPPRPAPTPPAPRHHRL